MKHDPLADVFSVIKNMEDIGRRQALVPATKLAHDVLTLMKEHGYIGDFPTKGSKLQVELKGKVNNCRVIRPRFSVQKGKFIKWEKRFLPANTLGILILTTTKGVMDHRKAKQEGLGGQLIGFVY